jgi:hypothetical protein
MRIFKEVLNKFKLFVERRFNQFKILFVFSLQLVRSFLILKKKVLKLNGNSFKQNSIIAKEILETEIQSFLFQLIWKDTKNK